MHTNWGKHPVLVSSPMINSLSRIEYGNGDNDALVITGYLAFKPAFKYIEYLVLNARPVSIVLSLQLVTYFLCTT